MRVVREVSEYFSPLYHFHLPVPRHEDEPQPIADLDKVLGKFTPIRFDCVFSEKFYVNS